MKTLAAMTLAGLALAPMQAQADWSGFYFGASAGNVTEGKIGDSGTGELEVDKAYPGGLFLGYQQQSGRLVFGGEYAIGIAGDIDFKDREFQNKVAYGEGDLKARVGYSFGEILAYGLISSTAVIFTDGDDELSASGLGIGVGVDFAASRNLIVGFEYIARDLEGEVVENGFQTADDVDFDVNSFTFRVSYKF